MQSCASGTSGRAAEDWRGGQIRLDCAARGDRRESRHAPGIRGTRAHGSIQRHGSGPIPCGHSVDCARARAGGGVAWVTGGIHSVTRWHGSRRRSRRRDRSSWCGKASLTPGVCIQRRECRNPRGNATQGESAVALADHLRAVAGFGLEAVLSAVAGSMQASIFPCPGSEFGRLSLDR